MADGRQVLSISPISTQNLALLLARKLHPSKYYITEMPCSLVANCLNTNGQLSYPAGVMLPALLHQAGTIPTTALTLLSSPASAKACAPP